MVFSLLMSVSASKQWDFVFIPATGRNAQDIPAADDWNSGHTSR
jgi:hypothetical protein